MGALTSKPTSFNFRTWDLNSMMYVSCQDSLVPLIRVDLYQRKIVRVLPLDDWISDNIRFLFLNLDKQTFKFPGLIFKLHRNRIFYKTRKLLRQHTYISVMNYLLKKINKKRNEKLNLNMVLGSVFTKNLNFYYRLASSKVNLNFIVKNSFLQLQKTLDLQEYNDIILLNVNPRLESPLFNLKLKDLDSENCNIKSIGDYNCNYVVVNNNLKILVSQSSKDLLVYSEANKNNKFILELKNNKYNLSPVYLNNPLAFSEMPIISKKDSIDFNIGMCSELNNKKNFNVMFATHILDLNFDIYLPISNYFVTSGSLISIKGVQNLKMIRPSFSLDDHIKVLSVMLKKKLFNITKMPVKIFNFVKFVNTSKLINRLSFNFRTELPLNK